MLYDYVMLTLKPMCMCIGRNREIGEEENVDKHRASIDDD